VAPRYGDRHDVRYTDQERLTSSVQLSTFNGVTERAHGGREWGQARNSEDRAFDPPDLSRHRSYGRVWLRRTDMGTDTMSDIPIRNVQRPTFNSPTFNGATERAHGGREWGQTRNLGDRTLDPVDLCERRSGGPSRLWCPDMGTDTMSDMPVRNVQRETFNSQLSTG